MAGLPLAGTADERAKDYVRNVLDEFSCMQPYREYASACSYCRRPKNKGRVAYGNQVKVLTVPDYEHILERGWIRCGHHVYQPQNARSCCPNLGIRLDAMLFTPSKEQLKVLQQTHKYLTGERPILLPTNDATDVLEQLLALTEAGKAHEAAELVVRHRLKGVSAFGGAEESEDEGVGDGSESCAAGGAGASAKAVPVESRKVASKKPADSVAAAGRMSLGEALATPIVVDGPAAAAPSRQQQLHAAACAAAASVLQLVASRAMRTPTAPELLELMSKSVVSEQPHSQHAACGADSRSAATASSAAPTASEASAAYSLNAAFLLASAPYWPAAPAPAAAASTAAPAAAPGAGAPGKARRGSGGAAVVNPRVAVQLEIASALSAALQTGGVCSSSGVSGPGAVSMNVPSPLPARGLAAAGEAWAAGVSALSAVLPKAPDGAPSASNLAFLDSFRHPRPAPADEASSGAGAAGGAGAAAAVQVTDDKDDPEGRINCLTAHTPAQRRALAARYRRMQVAREAAGLRAFIADPLGFSSLKPDEDGAHPPSDTLDDDELDFALEQAKKGDDDDDGGDLDDGAEDDGASSEGSDDFSDAVEDKDAAADSDRAADAALATGGASDSLSPAAASAGGAGGPKRASSRGPKPAPGSRAWKEAERARRIRRAAAAKEASDVAKSERELKTFLASGVGSQMRQLRASAEAFARSAASSAGSVVDGAAVNGTTAPAAAAGSAGAGAGAVSGTPAAVGAAEKLVRAAARGLPKNRAPVIASSSSGAANAAGSSATASAGSGAGAGAELPAHLLLPFGRGPLRLRVRLVRPKYTVESHELYTRFNMSLHRGTPASNSAASYTRHLIETPVPYMAPSDIGLSYRWACALAGEPAVPPPAADLGLGSLFANWAVPASAEAAAAPAPAASHHGAGADATHATPVSLRGLGARHALLASAAVNLGVDGLAPGEIGPALLASLAEEDALCAWVLSTVARRTEIAERARLRRAARRAARHAAAGVDGSGSGSGSSASADSASAILRALGAAAGGAADDDDDADDLDDDAAEGKVDDAMEADGAPLPLVQAVPPLPSVLDALAASMMDLAADLNLPPAALLLGLLALADVIVGQARRYNKAMLAHNDAAAAAAAEEAATAAAGGAGDAKRARLAGDADAAGAAQRRNSSGAGGPQSELAQMRAAMRSLSSMLGLPPGSLGDDMGDDDGEDEESGLGSGKGAGGDGSSGSGGGRRIPPKPSIPAGWLSPHSLFSQWTNVLTAAEDSVAWMLEAARATLDGIFQSVRTAAAYNRERPAPVPAPAAAQLASFIRAVPRDAPAVPSALSVGPIGPAADGVTSSASAGGAGGAGGTGAGAASGAAAAAANNATAAGATAAGAAEPRVLVDGWDLRLGFGTFFQEYWVESDARLANGGSSGSSSCSKPVLLAVGVLDVLPSRVASIYFFYNPSFRHLSLGKLSAQVEVFLAQQIYTHCAGAPDVLGLPPGLPPLCRWWDANLIAHAVSTMSYKRRFAPSQLMCPRLHRGHWCDLTREVQLALDMDLSHPLGPRRTWPTLPPAAKAHPKLADVAPIAAEARAEAESLGASLDAVEEAEAEELMPATLHLLPPSQRSAALFGGLTGHAQDLLRRGMRRFMAAAGPTLCRRIVFDPSWMAALESRQRSEKAALAAFRQSRATAIAAAVASAAAVGAHSSQLASSTQ